MIKLPLLFAIVIISCNDTQTGDDDKSEKVDTLSTEFTTSLTYGEVGFEIRTQNGISDTFVNADVIIKMYERLAIAEDSLNKCLGR